MLQYWKRTGALDLPTATCGTRGRAPNAVTCVAQLDALVALALRAHHGEHSAHIHFFQRDIRPSLEAVWEPTAPGERPL